METLKKDSDNPFELTLQNTNFEIFDCSNPYVSCCKMYLGYYQKMLNYKSINCIDFVAFIKWFEKKYEFQIIQQHFAQKFNSQKMELELIWICK